MRLIIKAVAASSLAAASFASQAGAVLNFDSYADAPKTAAVGKSIKGFEFGANGYFATSQWDANGLGNFADAPSGFGALMLSSNPDFPSGGGNIDLVINVTNGFSSKFWLSWATSSAGSGVVRIFDGLNGRDKSGGDNALFTVQLLSTGACDGNVACNWRDNGIDTGFAVNAYSLRITGSDSNIFFDNMSFGDAVDTGNNVPEPGSLALALAGFGAAAWGVRRRHGAPA